MNPIRTITVYCSSSRHVDGIYRDAAEELGEQIARRAGDDGGSI